MRTAQQVNILVLDLACFNLRDSWWPEAVHGSCLFHPCSAPRRL